MEPSSTYIVSKKIIEEKDVHVFFVLKAQRYALKTIIIMHQLLYVI